MFTLATGETLRGVAGSASAITYTLTGDEKGTTDGFKVLAQGQLPAVAASLGGPTGSNRWLVQTVFMLNTTPGAVAASLYINGVAGSNQIFGLSIPANGSAILAADGWHVYDSTGAIVTTSTLTLTGDVTGSGSGSIATTIANNAVTNAKANDMPANTFKGNNTGVTADPIDLTIAQTKTALNLAGTNSGDQNVFSTVTGNTGTANADSTADSLAITGTGAVSTAATDSPDGLVISLVADGVTNALLADAPANTMKGNYTGSADNPTDGALAANTFFGRSSTGNITAKSITDAAFTWLTHATSAAQTAALDLATTALKGLLSALDKKKLDNMYIDVTANSIALVLTTNTGAQNITAINAILAAAPAGATIFFPGGTYNFNAAWTVPAKAFVYQGQGGGLTGGMTILAWDTNVGGDLITIPNLTWYSKFKDLCFVSAGVTQSAGAVVNINGNAFTDFEDCTFGATGGGFLFNLLSGPANLTSLPISDNSWNQSVISNCIGTGYKGTAILVNSRGSSLVVENSTFNGQWGTTAQCAVAGVNGKWVGALQFTACDFIGHQNNMLFDPTAASSEVCASVHCTNTYFDLSLGSCIKVAGTGATVRMKFDTCTFTTSNGGTGFSAVELAGSFVYAAGGQDVAFVNCNIYNTFATTGTTNGVLITNAADVSFINVKIAGWTNGYNITPMASNKTNIQIIGGVVGPSGGYGGNSVGYLIAAGAYKGLQIRANYCVGNTTALTLGAVTVLAGEASAFAITDNPGINPRGAVATPAVPAAGTTVTNTTGFRVQVFARNGATAPAAIVVNGVSVATHANTATTGGNSIPLDPGGTIAFTTTTVTSWTWVGK